MKGWSISSRLLSVILFLLAVAACGDKDSSSDFSNPQLVTIQSYTGDAMEPFISRDGAYLFFNNNGDGTPNKDLFYATRLNDTTFQFKGPIAAINTTEVDGVPTLDNANRFYYVSLGGYNPPGSTDTLRVGTWNGTTVNGNVPVAGMANAILGIIYFDIEVSPDNSTLYLSEGDFSDNTGIPSTADIVIAVNSGGNFALHPYSATIMANVNTAKFEYAPAISANGLELFFTRLDLDTMQARIYRSVRSGISSGFGAPQLVSPIEGFVEAPAFSPDEKSLYYHRQNTSTGKFEIYRVTRP